VEKLISSNCFYIELSLYFTRYIDCRIRLSIGIGLSIPMYILGILAAHDDPLNKHRDFQCSLAGLGPAIES